MIPPTAHAEGLPRLSWAIAFFVTLFGYGFAVLIGAGLALWVEAGWVLVEAIDSRCSGGYLPNALWQLWLEQTLMRGA